ncbi:MAG: homoserine dehydrogenase [Rhizobiales bacterium TMED83]|jgi:homoserine dehydrogenase|nr:homoserine dehydrogenase [Rhodobiaceae bacterium]RPF94628.1 MAG: homoserine dehydrogenase [Rhizobiales bacterium TMED83]
MNGSLRIGLAGLGTVGVEVAGRLLDGAVPGVTLTAVCARDKARERGLDLSAVRWVDQPVELAEAGDVDLVVELIGGTGAPAATLIETALAAGKSVVTANKALLADRAMQLAVVSEASGASLAYEAAVAGGIPVIKTLREALAGNKISRVSGILNGTCNFILSQMESSGVSFATALKDAQQRGFAEAEPDLDISGMDAAQKLALLAGLAFGVQPDVGQISVTGIEAITDQDISFADEFDSVIRLIAIAGETPDGLVQCVAPMLVGRDHALAQVKNELNAVALEASPVGQLFLQGPGAGGGATASAVLADIADLAQGFGRPIFGTDALSMEVAKTSDLPPQAWYLRLALADAPGSMASVTQVLAQSGVSIEEVVQRSRNADDTYLPVVFITHKVDAKHLRAALSSLANQDTIRNQVLALPVFEA